MYRPAVFSSKTTTGLDFGLLTRGNGWKNLRVQTPPSTPMHRRCHARAGKALPQVNDDLLGKYSRHRQFNSPISRELMADTGTRDIGQKIANCALTLKTDVLIHPDFPPEVELKAARVCNTRLCPFCEWRRTRVWRGRLSEGLTKVYEDSPRLRGVFLTLTVKNPRLEDLGQTLDEMNKAWDRLTRRAFFPTDLWFRRTEITVAGIPGSPNFSAHPHFHVLLLVPPAYFGRNYIKQTEWQKQWMTAARLDYAPIVDVRCAKTSSGLGSTSESASKAAVLEAAKYAAKATALMELGPAITELHWQLRNRRLYAMSTQLRKYIKSGDIEADELMDKAANPLPEGTEKIEAIAQWFEDSNEYLITDLGI